VLLLAALASTEPRASAALALLARSLRLDSLRGRRCFCTVGEKRTLSTKNLARTVIEGGRTWYSIDERRRSSKTERKHVRSELHALRIDPELWDELALTPRKPVRREFDDKLAPAYRFLSSRADKKWNESYALLRRRFDDRTTAGRHILFCHLLDSVEHVGEHHHSEWIPHRGKFQVDEEGVLRKVTRPTRKKRVSGASPRPDGLQASVYETDCPWFDSKRGGCRRAPCLAGARASVS
jgi:hypothetical protein